MPNIFLKRLLLLGCAVVAFPVTAAYAQETGEEAATEDSDRVMNTIQVRGEFIPEPQRATSQVATFLAPEDLERTADSNAALALTRLSGISIVSDKFAFVRGLGDRYSSALLNGSPLPSPEPLRRTVPLDLFPANALDGATVQKTFSAKYPGEFGGGIIDLRTLRQPRDNFFNIKLGTGYNSETNSEDGLFVRGSDSDWSGFDDGLRDIPSELRAVLSSNQELGDYDDATIEAAGESLVNSPLTVLQTGEVDPDFDGEVEFGRVFEFDTFDLGLIAVGGYSNGWTTKQATRQRVQGGVNGSNFETTETTYSATLNALASATLNYDNHELQGTIFYVHDTDKEAQINRGADFNAPDFGSPDPNYTVHDESSGWYERGLTMGQLRGEHIFGDLIINWRGAVAESTRDAPYERSLRRFINSMGVPAYSLANNYRLNFSYLTDQITSVGGDAKYETYWGEDSLEFFFTVGADYSKTERAYELYKFKFAGGNSLPDDVEIARPDFLFSPDNIEPARFELDEDGDINDFYDGDLEVSALFAEADVELTSYIRATVGGRYEDGEQSVVTSNRFGQSDPNSGSTLIANSYFLPSVSLTWNFADDLQMRLAYSETISRPQFRELAPSTFTDPETDRTYRGNPFLMDTELTNFDARLEYYMGRSEFVTLAGFFKEIENPIEETQFSTSTFVFETGFINVPKAELIGAEFEYRTRFDIPFGGDFFLDREGLFSVNYTYTKSEIVAGSGDTIINPLTYQAQDATLYSVDGEQLQGTPENILNLQLGWESDVEQLTLLLGWVDERILQRGVASASGALPNIIEDPGFQLDLVYNRDLMIAGRDFSLGLRARNLLNEAHEEFQISEGGLGRTEFNTYDRGVSVSASVTAKF
ncbi:MAG: TonB-dependent receptor [Ponticaulis sp.]|nr:TonB-dependent receptor [Ponticaulis sp.]|tara:strand:+ start:45361 stop:47991 length:2631 start_codon:yes stop_codon:yes gene_type:complete